MRIAIFGKLGSYRGCAPLCPKSAVREVLSLYLKASVGVEEETEVYWVHHLCVNNKPCKKKSLMFSKVERSLSIRQVFVSP